MVEDIYGGIHGSLECNELGSPKVVLVDSRKGDRLSYPTLVLQNRYAIKRMRDYLNDVLEKIDDE